MDRWSPLPPELLTAVLRDSHPRDVISSKLVCRFWCQVINQSAELQYAIELWRDGRLRGTTGKATSTESLAQLLARRKAWQNLDWCSQTRAPIQSLHHCGAHVLTQGLLAVRDIRADKLYTLPLPSSTDPDGIHCPKVGETFVMGIAPQHFYDFEIDSGQDLLVVLYAEPNSPSPLTGWGLDARQLSRPAQRHPQAMHAQLIFARAAASENIWDTPVVALQIVDNIVAVFFSRSCRLFVVDWRKSTVVLSIAFHQEPLFCTLGVVECFVLDPSSFLLVCRGEPFSSISIAGSIRLYTFEPTYSFSPLGITPNATAIAIFALPLTAPQLCWGPVNVASSAGPFTTHHAPSRPHFQSLDRRIITFTIAYGGAFDTEPHPEALICLVVHIRIFLQMLQQYRRAPDNHVASTKPWAEWGPMHTRLFPGMDLEGFVPGSRHVSGEKMVSTTVADARIQVRVFDFGPLVDGQTNDEAQPNFCVLHDTASELQITLTVAAPSPEEHSFAGDWPAASDLATEIGLFKEPVCSALPYREVRRHVPPPEDDPQLEYGVFSMNDDHILATEAVRGALNGLEFKDEITIWTMY
ncbi:F-box domain-containing protein [Mycena indigotica]|uniref:F-box domain-containing protein n=1 Tax=Mycena indigotica TaxID=2126181 RepID=A0A8H6SA01_9AGAR|nr:F-box domain-containing protein [Mycena indigotica]KAF7295715.1 F-box domain-containing protein [Mycena indigotica]